MSIYPYKINDIVYNPEQGKFIITRMESNGKIWGNRILKNDKRSKIKTRISRYGLVIVITGENSWKHIKS